MTFESYNDFHLGDNLIHLNFLRRLAIKHPDHQFRHWLQPCHIEPLRAIADVPKGNLELASLEGEMAVDGSMEKRPANARNVWKNAGGFWEGHKLRNDWANFHVAWFALMAGEMGLQSPIADTMDLLLDYPAIVSGLDVPRFDVLFVNSQPCSGQFLDFDTAHCMDPMINALVENGLKVVCTQPTPCGAPCTRDWGLNITQIGSLSLTVPYHVMVATGPMWTTFNIWNTLTTKLRLLMLGNGERLNMPVPIEQVSTKDQAWKALERHGLL